MDILHERRRGADRREFALYYRYGVERRVNTQHRRCKGAGGEMSDYEMAMSEGYWGDAEDDSTRE